MLHNDLCIFTVSSPKDNSDGIRMITQDELENEGELLMKTATSEVYKGKYRRFQVAIKRYMEPVNRSPRSVPRCWTTQRPLCLVCMHALNLPQRFLHV